MGLFRKSKSNEELEGESQEIESNAKIESNIEIESNTEIKSNIEIKSNTYCVIVTCNNCEEEAEFDILCGTKVEEFLKDKECETCRCKILGN